LERERREAAKAAAIQRHTALCNEEVEIKRRLNEGINAEIK